MAAVRTHVFLLSYNERVMLPLTVAHYRRQLPNSRITILDNDSTDGSAELARSLGCEVLSFSSAAHGLPNGTHNEFKGREMKNEAWKGVEEGWVVVADIDEWLRVSEPELQREAAANATVLRVQGFQMVGNSSSKELADIDPAELQLGVPFSHYCKPLCFRRPHIQSMGYLLGAHSARPKGRVAYSGGVYANMHMAWLGREYITARMARGFSRLAEVWAAGPAFSRIDRHYKMRPAAIATAHARFLEHPLLTNLSNATLPVRLCATAEPYQLADLKSLLRWRSPGWP